MSAARRVSRPLRPTAETVEELADEVRRLLHVDLGQAERLAESLSRLAARVGGAAVGVAHRCRGHLAFQRGRYHEALAHYRAAGRVFRTLGAADEYGRVLMATAGPLSQLGRHGRALDAVSQAHRIFVGANDWLRVARADSNTAALLFRQDRLAEALRVGRRAERSFARAAATEDIVISQLNTAAHLTSLHAFAAAERYYARVRRLCVHHGLSLLLVEAEANLAYLFALRGDFSRAFGLYTTVRGRAEQAGQRSLALAILLDEAELLVELNANRQARPLLDDALLRARADGLRYEAGKARQWLGVVAAREHRVDEALDWFDQAKREFAAEGNQTRVALTVLSAALILSRTGRAEAADTMAESARSVLIDSGLYAKAAMADLVLAQTSFGRGDLRQAVTHLDSARRHLRRHPSPTLAWQLAWLTGVVAEAQGRLPQAASAYARAYRLLEGLRGQMVQEELKVAFLDDKAVVYEAMIAMAMRGHPSRRVAARAFVFIEQGRSRALADLLAQNGTKAGPMLTTAAVRTLRARLHACYREIDRLEVAVERPSVQRLAGLRTRARASEHALSTALFNAAPRAGRLADVQVGSVVSLADLQSRLGPSVFLEYFEVRGHLHVLVADRDQSALVPLGPLAPVLRTVRLALFSMTQARSVPLMPRIAPGSDAVYEHLRVLWQALMEPVAAWISPDRPLVVAAHGLLHRLPFHALLGPRGYLGETSPVTMSPSGTAVVLGGDRVMPTGRGTLVLGLPDSRAPRIRDEARAVGALMAPATVLMGRRATARALQTLGRRARVVHIATHGFFRDDNPMLSSIRLANTRLNVHDLYGMRLSADLVTLSGCATGVSLVTGGDELVGLTRGLLAAGARSVHLSLWDVDDVSTTHYMSAFYRHYRVSFSPSEAARAAASATRAQYPHPYFWAPFMVVGHAS